MATLKLNFTKSAIASLIKAGLACKIRDLEIKGLHFVVGTKRSCFTFERRIAGHKGPAIKITIGAFPAISIDDARIEALRLSSLCQRGIDPRNKPTSDSTHTLLSLQTLIAKFWDVKKGISPSTRKRYQNLVTFIPSSWLSMAWNDLSPEMICEQFHLIRSSATYQCWDFLRLLNNIHNSCSPFFKDDHRKPLLKSNPVPDARLMLASITPNPPKRSVVPAWLLGKLIVLLENPMHNNVLLEKPCFAFETFRVASELILLALFTGFRRGELINLKWSYLDLEQGSIHLPGFVRGENGDFHGTKNRQDHFIPLASYPLELLRNIAGKRRMAGPYVFSAVTDPNKPFVFPSTFSDLLSKEIGTHFSPHATRRTFASIANDVGLDFLSVKRMLNHHFEGGVTGGYVVQGFNPVKVLKNFQLVCDFILERRAQYLGENPKVKKNDEATMIRELRAVATSYRIELRASLEKICNGDLDFWAGYTEGIQMTK